MGVHKTLLALRSMALSCLQMQSHADLVVVHTPQAELSCSAQENPAPVLALSQHVTLGRRCAACLFCACNTYADFTCRCAACLLDACRPIVMQTCLAGALHGSCVAAGGSGTGAAPRRAAAVGCRSLPCQATIQHGSRGEHADQDYDNLPRSTASWREFPALVCEQCFVHCTS